MDADTMKPKHPHLLTLWALGLVMPASADVIYSNLQNINPHFPPSGPATGFSIGPHLKSKFLAVHGGRRRRGILLRLQVAAE